MYDTNILIVDDRLENQLTLEIQLEDIPCNILKASNYYEAIESAKDNELLLILMDVNMPGKNGFDTASDIRKIKGKETVPIIFVTADKKDYSDVSRGYNIGAVDYLFKPVDDIILKSKINFFLKLYNKEKEILFYQKNLEKIVAERTHDLEIAKKEAERADILKTDFLANMSHEMRTPLTHIMGYTEILESFIDDPEQNSYLDVIIKASNNLLALIESILDLSRMESDDISINEEDIDINKFLTAIFEIYSSNSKNDNKIYFNLNIDKDTNYHIKTDSRRLRQLIFNLLSNAFKFTESGAVELGYELKNNKNIKIYVKDTGIGIDEEHKDKIYNRFYQIESHKSRKYGGTGIGLSIVKKIAEYLNTKIMLESEPEKGSVFSMDFELTEIISKVQEDIKVSPKILAVDDNEEVLNILKYYFKRNDIDLITAVNGIDGIDKFREYDNIDIVIMDIQMPVLNGMDAIKKIIEMENNKKNKTYKIAFTAYAMEDDIKNCLAAGFNEMVCKPVSPGWFTEKVIQIARERQGENLNLSELSV